MAFQSDQDWQLTKKTVSERNSHMFNNPLMSDVKLTCGESKAKRKCFYAHKYVLATSSPVFYAMFYGELDEKNPVVHLEDGDEESLEEFLRFLYTDECTLLTPESEITVKVLYLAKKYNILSLAEKCIKVLQDSMKPANAVIVLEQAIHVRENELEEKCWTMIDDHTSEAVTSDAFIHINQNTLINILKRERLNIEEIDLFQAVLQWSESECKKKGLEVTGINKRAVLGDALYQFRFLSMSQNEFAHYVASQSGGLLTAEEIVSIYQRFNGCDVPSSEWKLAIPRQRDRLRCGRFAVFLSARWSSESHYNSLSFSINKPSTFRGVCLFGAPNVGKYDVTLTVKNAKVSGLFTSELKNKSPKIYGYDVMLSTPILVDENQVVTMVATTRGPPSYKWQCRHRASIEFGGATVTFTNSSESSNYTNVEHGQFYEIILSI